MPTDTFANLTPEKRRRVIDAALDEFSEHGYELASISRMVARAGIAKGSFYQYFESKLDLFEWLLVEELGRQKLEFVERHPAPPGSDFFGTLEAAMYAGVRWALDQPRLARITEAIVAPSSDRDLRALSEKWRRVGHEAMSTLLRAGQASGEVRSDLDLGLAGAVLSVTLQAGIDRALWQRFGLDLLGLMRDPARVHAITDEELRALVHEVVDILCRGFGQAGGHWTGASIDFERIARAWKDTR